MSMEANHTPGPWGIEQREHRDSPLYVDNPDIGRVAKCSGLNLAGFISPEQERANAKLISAAPELLTALEWARSILSRDGIAPLIGEAFTSADLEMINKAIAKAKGR